MAAIGFAFDIYVLLMLPLIIKPALAALGGVAAVQPYCLHPAARIGKWQGRFLERRLVGGFSA
jgi:hypothetical protein